MKTLTLQVPIMYADHHVLRVRDALNGLDGVAETTASAARRNHGQISRFSFNARA